MKVNGTHLLGEPPDALHEVLVGGGVVGDDLAHGGDGVEGELVVRLRHERVCHVAELHHHHASALLQHAIRLTDRFLWKVRCKLRRLSGKTSNGGNRDASTPLRHLRQLTSLLVTLRRPKTMVYRSKDSSGKGSCSAFPSTKPI